MPAKLITAPAVEPVTLAEAKAHLYVTHSDDDALIGSLIAAAREDVEHWLQRALVEQTWELALAAFPYSPPVIKLPMAPLSSITSIKYLDSDGVEQTLAATDYTADTSAEPGAVVPAYGLAWPATRAERNAVRVRYVAGYGADATIVPASIKAFIKMRVGALYENRESFVAGQPIHAAPRDFSYGLIARYKVYS
jgi:uncharacterized phiE125 gp8 family phage protein